MWHEYFRIYPGCHLVTTKAIPHRLCRRSVHYTALHKGLRINFRTVILEQANDSEEERQKAKTSRLISNIVLVITLIITIAAMWWIWKKMLEVRPAILRERRIAKKWVLV